MFLFFFKNSTQRILTVGCCVVLVFAVFLLNYFFPIYADDMMYSVIKYGETFDFYKNLSEIGNFLYYYYFNWGGRLVGIGGTHLVLLFAPIIQNIILTSIFLLLIFISSAISLQGQKKSFFVFLFTGVSIFYFTPSFLSSTVWITGGCVFLLTTTLSVAFIYFVYRLYISEVCRYDNSISYNIIFFLFGLVAGWSTENTGPTVVLIVFLFSYLYYLEHKNIPNWVIAGFIGLSLGCFFMIFSPGNVVRAEKEGYESLFNSWDIIIIKLENLYAMYRYFMLVPIIIYILSIVLFYLFPCQEISKRKLLKGSLVFFICANISIWMTLLSPSFPPRAFMSITVLTIIAIGILYANIDFKKTIPFVLNGIFLVVLLFFAAKDYMTFLKGSVFLHRVMADRELIIDRALKEGKNEITLEKVYMDYRFEYSDFSNYYKDYYGVTVHFVDKDEPLLLNKN